MKQNILSNSLTGLTRVLVYIGAIWILLIMLLICADVFSRVILNSPIMGVPEIVTNSISSITFLCLPFATMKAIHIRSTLFLEKASATRKSILDILSYVLGTALFIAIFISEWKPMLVAIKILEYEGEGSLRVPTYPVRMIIVFCCFITAIHCLVHLVQSIKNLKAARNVVKVAGGEE